MVGLLAEKGKGRDDLERGDEFSLAMLSFMYLWKRYVERELGMWVWRLGEKTAWHAVICLHSWVSWENRHIVSSHSDEGFSFFFLLVTKSERTVPCKNLHPLEEVHGLFSIVKCKGHSATVTKYWKKKLWMVVPSNYETQNHSSYMCDVKETLRSCKHSSENWWFVKCWVLILFL